MRQANQLKRQKISRATLQNASAFMFHYRFTPDRRLQNSTPRRVCDPNESAAYGCNKGINKHEKARMSTSGKN
jgi:hypothetical protein